MADEEVKDRPPRRERAPRNRARTQDNTPPPPPEEPAPTPPKKRTPADKKLASSIASTYQGIGLMVTAAGMSRGDGGVAGTGTAIVEQAEAAAEAWLVLADQNPKVKAALRKFTEGSAFAGLVAVHIPVVMPLLASRGVIPVSFAEGMAAASMMNGNTPDGDSSSQ